MYTYFDLSAFSEWFYPFGKSDLTQTINSTILHKIYKMCMHMLPDRKLNTVDRRSVDKWAIFDRFENCVVNKNKR